MQGTAIGSWGNVAQDMTSTSMDIVHGKKKKHVQWIGWHFQVNQISDMESNICQGLCKSLIDAGRFQVAPSNSLFITCQHFAPDQQHFPPSLSLLLLALSNRSHDSAAASSLPRPSLPPTVLGHENAMMTESISFATRANAIEFARNMAWYHPWPRFAAMWAKYRLPSWHMKWIDAPIASAVSMNNGRSATASELPSMVFNDIAPAAEHLQHQSHRFCF